MQMGIHSLLRAAALAPLMLCVCVSNLTSMLLGTNAICLLYAQICKACGTVDISSSECTHAPIANGSTSSEILRNAGAVDMLLQCMPTRMINDHDRMGVDQ